jgi:hypothetical protein
LPPNVSRELREADDLIFGSIGDVGFSVIWEQMVLTETVHGNTGLDDQPIRICLERSHCGFVRTTLTFTERFQHVGNTTLPRFGKFRSIQVFTHRL